MEIELPTLYFGRISSLSVKLPITVFCWLLRYNYTVTGHSIPQYIHNNYFEVDEDGFFKMSSIGAENKVQRDDQFFFTKELLSEVDKDSIALYQCRKTIADICRRY
jgi:hypothetical protein